MLQRTCKVLTVIGCILGLSLFFVPMICSLANLSEETAIRVFTVVFVCFSVVGVMTISLFIVAPDLHKWERKEMEIQVQSLDVFLSEVKSAFNVEKQDVYDLSSRNKLIICSRLNRFRLEVLCFLLFDEFCEEDFRKADEQYTKFLNENNFPFLTIDTITFACLKEDLVFESAKEASIPTFKGGNIFLIVDFVNGKLIYYHLIDGFLALKQKRIEEKLKTYLTQLA